MSSSSRRSFLKTIGRGAVLTGFAGLAAAGFSRRRIRTGAAAPCPYQTDCPGTPAACPFQSGSSAIDHVYPSQKDAPCISCARREDCPDAAALPSNDVRVERKRSGEEAK